MAASKAKQTDSTPQEPPASVPTPFSGHHDHSFTLQAVMEIRQSVGELKASVDAMNTTLQSTKAKVDDLVGWKNKILGGAIVLGAVCAIAGFFITKFSDYVTLSPPVKVTQPAK